MGYIREEDVWPFGILWPFEQVFNHMNNGKIKYRVVTNPVKPFVIEEEPHEDYKNECALDTICVKIPENVTDKETTIRILRDYESGVWNSSNPYTIHCCRGLAIDLLNRLASDLDFSYTLYIVHDTTYGKDLNGSWNGMVEDLIQGTAHMAIAAFSITRSRQGAIDFTYPYYFSRFSILYSEQNPKPTILAFLEPFDSLVWFGILISATVSAFSMALFEWNSPFGLNPWGRKRKQNYTLASGLTMVWSVIFGHTVKTKSPKSWPSKVMQNFWSFICIFVIASYTANLAAFLAGNFTGINYHDIFDSRVSSIRYILSVIDKFVFSDWKLLNKKYLSLVYSKCILLDSSPFGYYIYTCERWPIRTKQVIVTKYREKKNQRESNKQPNSFRTRVAVFTIKLPQFSMTFSLYKKQ